MSYGVAGAAQPMVDDDTCKWTDCFVVLVSSNGEMIGPFMFTGSKDFDKIAIRARGKV